MSPVAGRPRPPGPWRWRCAPLWLGVGLLAWLPLAPVAQAAPPAVGTLPSLPVPRRLPVAGPAGTVPAAAQAPAAPAAARRPPASASAPAPAPSDLADLPDPLATAGRWEVLTQDITLARTLERWARDAGVRLKWDAQRNFLIGAPDRYEGTFESALRTVLGSSGIRQSDYPLEACIYANTPPLVRITRQGEQAQECNAP